MDSLGMVKELLRARLRCPFWIMLEQGLLKGDYNKLVFAFHLLPSAIPKQIPRQTGSGFSLVLIYQCHLLQNTYIGRGRCISQHLVDVNSSRLSCWVIPF